MRRHGGGRLEDGMPCFSHRRSLCVNIKQLRVLIREYEMRCSKGVTDLLHCWRADIAEVKKTYCVDQGEAPRGGWLWPSLYKYCMYSTSCILIIVVVPGQHNSDLHTLVSVQSSASSFSDCFLGIYCTCTSRPCGPVLQ